MMIDQLQIYISNQNFSLNFSPGHLNSACSKLSHLPLPWCCYQLPYVSWLKFSHTPKPRHRDLSLTSSSPSSSTANKLSSLVNTITNHMNSSTFLLFYCYFQTLGFCETSLVYYKSYLMGLILMLSYMQSSFQITSRVKVQIWSSYWKCYV